MYVLFEATSCSSGAPAAERRSADGRGSTRRRLTGRPGGADPAEQHVVILSGLSGGGKTAAAKLFEDLGYTVVDNLPGELLPDLAELVSSGPRAVRPGRDRRSTSGPATRRWRSPRDARRARGPRHPAPGRLPRGPRRGPHPALLARRATGIRSATGGASPARSPRSAACSTRSAPRRTSSSTPPTCRCASCASGCSRSSATTTEPGPARDPAHQLRLQVRRPARGRPRVRRPVHAEPVLRPRAAPALRPDRAGPRLRPRPARSTARFLDLLERVPRVHASRPTSAEGKTRLTIAIGCTGGYHRSIVIAEALAALAARAGPRAGRGLPPRARAGVTRETLRAALAHARASASSAGCSSSSSGCSCSPSACAHVLRQVDPRPRARRRRSARSSTSSRSSSCRIPLRGLVVGGRRASASSRSAAYRRRPRRSPTRSAPPDAEQPLVEVIYQKRFLARGPRIVAIGGGTGLSALLRGLKEHTSNLTAIVTVADDGGSSGVAARGARDPAGRRHPQLHRGPRRRRAAHERAAPVPLPGRRDGGDAAPRSAGPRRPRGRQPAARGDDRARGRRLRGGRPADQPGPRGPRPGRARSRRRR